MKKVYLIFDYFKEAFHLNRANKVLYKPQIVLIIIKSILFLLTGAYVYMMVGNRELIDSIRYSSSVVKSLLPEAFGLILLGILVILLFAIASKVIESGLYNMYKNVINNNKTDIDDFWTGARKYFFPFLLGDILIAVCWVIAFVPYVVIGFLTLSLGFSVIPIVVSVFLTMWKTSLVMNDSNIIVAFKDSIKFAEKNFLPLLVLQAIHWSFVNNSGGSNVNWLSNANDDKDKIPDAIGSVPGGYKAIGSLIENVQLGIAIIVPVMVIAYMVATIIGVVFEIFFSISIFITYKNKFIPSEESTLQEVIQ